MKFLDFWVVGWKFTKFLMSFLEPRVSFSFNFASLFSARKHNSSVFFHLNVICFGQKDLIKVQIFRLSTACMKINQIPYAIFQATCQSSFKICINFQCHNTQFLWNFQIEKLYFLDKKSPSMYNFQTFECSNESPPNSLNAIFETPRSQGLFNFCITVQCHDR